MSESRRECDYLTHSVELASKMIYNKQDVTKCRNLSLNQTLCLLFL